MPVDSLKEMEGTPFTTAPETLRVRCPHCRKLYLVQFSDIQEAKPRFECEQCHTRFWLSMADMDLLQEVQGIPLRIKETPLQKPLAKPKISGSPRPCPKCFKAVDQASSECPHCGVMIEKVKNQLSFIDNLPAHSPTLAALWKRVLNQYSDEQVHQEFLRACQRERNLAYAGAQYAQMLKLMPADEMTIRRVSEVQALGSVMVPPIDSARKAGKNFPRLWQVPLMAAALVMAVGLVLPVFRNMVGVGAAFLFLAFAFRRAR